MNKKMYQTKEKVNKRSKKGISGAVNAFLLTLGIVLVVGIAGILLIGKVSGSSDFGQNGLLEDAEGDGLTSNGKLFAEQAMENEEGECNNGNDSVSIWEEIPQERYDKQIEGEQQPVESRYGHVLADPEYMKENHIIPWEGSSEDVVTLGFVGDILLDDEYAIMANLQNRGGTIGDGISQGMLEELRNVDILVANNEFPYTDRGTPIEDKAYTFRAEPSAVNYLHDMGVDVAVLANNHMFDFGEEGLLDTLDALSGAGIPYIGAGRNLEEASSPVYFIVNDMKIAIVAATQIERLDNPDTRGAAENVSGVFRCLYPEKLYEVISEADTNSDFVIVYMHWGTENVTEPDWAQLDQAPGLAAAGADLIIGNHPHCLQGIAYHEDVPVIYSLGNFWFNSKTVDTGMVQVEIDKEGLKSFRFVPAIQSDCKVALAYGAEKERILSHMRELSPGVVIDSEGYVSR